MTLIKMAWRNLWRNSRRTFITIFSMAFGLTMMIVGYALMDGMLNQMVHYATVLGTSHVQVHHPDYLEDHSLYDTINAPGTLLEDISGTGLGSAAPRIFATALVSSGQQSAGGQLWGIDPALENSVTELYKHLETGTWLAPDPMGQIVLGRNLARTLSAGPGDEVVVLTQAADGSLGNALYTVSGTLKSIGEALDRGGVIMHIKNLSDLLVMDSKVHEIAIRLNDPDALDTASSTLNETLDQKTYKVENWKQLFPELAEYLRVSSSSMTIILFIIFAVASLGIVNTQLMSLFERTREVGIMRALGLSPLSVAVLVLFETLFLAMIAAVAGGIAGVLWSLRLESVGWDISWMGGSFAFVGVAFDPHMYATLTPAAVIDSIVVMVIVVLIASLYPLFRAARISPVDAIGRGR
ncbi:MAG: FtsX-like permease family protein [bacterium]|nr:ABC transporter permease [bacterium]MDT8367195.1 FtsX-like permease family protein [bacterium]